MITKTKISAPGISSSARVQGKEEEGLLSAQADAFAGVKAEEKIGLLRSE